MARLTIPDEQTFAEFTVVTSTTAFPITFSLFAKADLTVKIDGTAVDQSAFTFTGTLLQGGGYDGGTVTLNSAVDDVTVRIERNVTPARTSNFAPSANTPTSNVDQAFNRLTATQQDLSRRLGTLTDTVLEDVLDELPVILEGLDLRRPFGGLWLHDYELDEDGLADGVGAMFRRAKAAGLLAEKPVYMLPGSYAIDGTPDSGGGLLVHGTAGLVDFRCATGTAVISSAVSTSRALFALAGGGDCHFDGITWDATNVTSNFAIKVEGGGDFSFGKMEVKRRGFRFVGTNGSINGDELTLTETQGHGFSAGSATGEPFGYSNGGYINCIIANDITGSDINWSATKVLGQLRIGSVIGRWTKWESDGEAYPTRYACVRLGNGTSNITIGYVYAEGKYRGVRLTDTDNCWVNQFTFKNLIGPAILFNRKDQRARNSGVLNVTGVGVCRGNRRNDIGVSDKDSELIAGEGDRAGVIQEGEGWTLGKMSVSADVNAPGSGLITASNASATVTNLDIDYVGQDYNCFKDVVVGDLLFSGGVVLGKVATIAARRYFSDAAATTVIGTLRAGDLTVALGGTSVTGVGTNFSGTMTAGDWIYDANGSKVGQIKATPAMTATTLTLVSGALVAVPGAAFRSGALPATGGSATQSLTLTGLSSVTTSPGVAYEQRTPDEYFYVANTGNITISGVDITNNSLSASALTGTIETSTSSTRVEGVGTLFDTELVIGQSLFKTDGTWIGQIADFGERDESDPDKVLSLTANAAVALAAGAQFKVGYSFVTQFEPGDLIFDSSLNYAGVVATVPTPLTATLTAATLAPAVTNAAFRYGKLYKCAVGLEVAESATDTNVNLDDVQVLGATVQHDVAQPNCIKPTLAQTITKDQLATLDATTLIGVRHYVSNLAIPGWVKSDGVAWEKENNDGLVSFAGTADYTHVYLDTAPVTRLTGTIATDKIITLSATGLPYSATMSWSHRGSGAGNWIIKNGGGTTLMTLRPGQFGTVIWDGSASSFRTGPLSNGGAAAAQILTGTGSPEGVVAGAIGDLRARTDGGPGTALSVKTYGAAGTNTGWTDITSAHDAVYAQDYGVVPGNPSNLVAFNLALDAANAAGKTLILPAGTLTIPDASPVFNILDNTRIVGAGRGLTKLYFTGLDSTTDVFSITGKSKVYIADLSLEASTERTSSNLAFAFFDCVDCTVYRCGQTNFTQGFVFARTSGAVPPTTTNLRNRAIECISLISRSYGFFMEFATACEFINCEAYGSTNQDGFKTGGGSTFCKIIGCHSEGNFQDGFDTYDGFIASIMESCTAYNNTAAGFQIKGTSGGSYSAGTYVGRESVISNCVAQGNASNGFLFQEARQIVVSGCVSVGNALSGFVFNNLQQFAVSDCLAVRNVQHGFSLISGTSRCSFTGCSAVDNSYVDGTVQNGTYDGWNLNTGSSNLFTGCRSTNGTEAGRLGGQGYGWNTTTSTSNIFTGCSALSNVTGPVGGTTPYTSNSFSGFAGVGVFYGVQVATDGTTPSVYRSGANAQFDVTRASGATVQLLSQASLGYVGTSSAHPFSIATSGTRRWETSTSGHFAPVGNNAYDVGASANGVRSLYVYTNIYRTTTVIQGAGTGSPEGVVTGGIGSIFQRTDGGAATSFYVKESGTGNTGWVAK